METQAVSEPSQAPAVETSESQVATATTQPVTSTQPTNSESDQDRNWRQARESLERERQEREYWQREATRLRESTRQPEVQEQVPPGKTLADFEFDESKYATYLSQQAASTATEAVRKELAQERERAAKEQREAAFEKRQVAFAKDNPAYYETMSKYTAGQSDAVLAEIMSSEEGPAIAMYLANNQDIARKLNQMDARDVAREFGRLEGKVVAERERVKAQNRIPVGEQPPPIPTLQGSGEAARVTPDSPESDTAWSAEEWARRRNKQLAKRGAS
jgi:hypothetical protein